MKKALALLLALLMVVGAVSLVACGGDKPDDGKKDPAVDPVDPGKDPGTDPVDPGTDPVDPGKDPGTDPVTPDDDAIFELTADYSGMDPIVLLWTDRLFYVDEPDKINDGDALSNAIYTRQLQVEEQLNTTYEVVSPEIDTYTLLDTAVTAGSHEYDMLTVHMKFGASAALQGQLRNVNKFPTIDLSKTWWNQSINENFGYKTTQYWVTGDITTGYIDNLVGVFVDDNMWEKYTGKTLDDLFTIVNDGKWTLEVVMEAVNGVYEDVNNDQIKNEGDFFGWCYDNTGWVVSALATSLGYTYSVKSGSKYVLELAGPANEAIFAKTKEFINNKDYVFPISGDIKAVFNDGNAMFIHQTLDVMGSFRERQEDFSIVPMPKMTEADEYRTPSYDGLKLVGIAATEPLERYDLIGAFAEKFAAMGNRYVTDALYETTFKAKFARNEGSFHALDLIRQTGFCDFAFCWTGPLGQIDIFLSAAIMGGAGSLATPAASQQAGYQKKLDGIYQTLAKLEKADKEHAE